MLQSKQGSVAVLLEFLEVVLLVGANAMIGRTEDMILGPFNCDR
jgi:hypothetical protein